MLFISALVLAATTLWDVVKEVSVFTLAHSMTLILAALNLVHLLTRVVEPMISASIVFVALQNVLRPGSVGHGSRLAAAFCFGLFHGLGFASGLLDVMREMPSSKILLALLAFSIGVETGHQMVLLPLFGILKLIRRTQNDTVSRTKVTIAIQRITSGAITVAGVYYLAPPRSTTPASSRSRRSRRSKISDRGDNRRVAMGTFDSAVGAVGKVARSDVHDFNREMIDMLHKTIVAALCVCAAMTCLPLSAKSTTDASVSWTDDRVDAVWQWSIAAPTIPGRRALLWIPTECNRVRGVCVAVQNMLEEPLFQRKAFRAACAENDLALLLIQSGHDRVDEDGKNPNHPPRSSLDIFLNPNFPKGSEDPRQAGEDLQKLLDTFAATTGYPELKFAPLMPVGHSSAGSFVWHLYRWDPQRFFAIMPFKTGMKDDGPVGIPIFNVESEWFDLGSDTKDVATKSDAIAHQRTIRQKQPGSLFSFYIDVGSGHCDVSDDSITMVSLFLKTVVARRIPADAPRDRPVQLTPIKLPSGFLIRPEDLGKAGVKPKAFGNFSGNTNDAFWYLDEALATAVQDHVTAQFTKKPQQINFVKSDGSVPATGGAFNTGVTVLDDAGTFRMDARYLDHMEKQDIFSPDTALGNDAEKILFRVNSGAVRQVGPNLFRVVPHIGPITPQGNPWEPTVVAYLKGDEQYQPTDRPAHLYLSLINRAGAPQTINFPAIPDHRATDSAVVRLNATASSGLPAQYFVGGGPVRLSDDGQSLVVSELPRRATFPIKVLVGAFQWGRPAGTQVQSAGPVFREFLLTR